jgi:hypothetical protein
VRQSLATAVGLTRDVISHPMLERALIDPSLWSPETVQALTSTLRHFRDV